ncbi:MAG: hypothetical protein A4E57_03033 [Syntrophorhabdaceae bacterium PtaU1.Bin034]|jgi:hypothetical protein|nr:MAG: hypothetical protein A4E57_03033 [Syntrophorhabdaceae bacterium PtaU1.Bin034]
MDQQAGVKQPLLGLLATFVVLFIAFGLIIWFETETFLTWAGYLAMTLIPFSIIIGMVWQTNYPPPAAKMEQPLKGIYLLLINFIVGVLVAAWSLKTVGGNAAPPTPFLVFFTIMTVIMTFWCVVVWQCWPATGIKGDHPAFVGFGTLIVSYALAWILYKTLFNFGFAKGAPFYSVALDPGGAFNAWVVLSFFLTALAVILAWAELDFWPLSLIPPKAPAFGRQPIWGIVVSLLVIVISLIVQSIFLSAGMDVVVYAVKVPICIIFGEFIMLLLFQTSPVQTVRQPGKGIVLIVLSVVLSVVMYHLYSWFSFLVAGSLPSGPPAYVLELWLATALLSFTFPVIATYTGAFNYWPLTEPRPQATAREGQVPKEQAAV